MNWDKILSDIVRSAHNWVTMLEDQDVDWEELAEVEPPKDEDEVLFIYHQEMAKIYKLAVAVKKLIKEG